MKIVIDTNVAISGLLWSGPPNMILKWARRRIVNIIISEKIVNEFKRVICHERFAHRLKVLLKAPEEVTAYLINISQFVPDPANIPMVILEDPFDNIFLALAEENDARLVVSGDKHLLSIREFRGIHIVKPSEACRIIEELSF
jgi:putative PIN family toxin of toxin-antitoxin system